MTHEQFAYWLQGFAELNPQAPTAEQWQAIRDHLQLVFVKVTPQRVVGPNYAQPTVKPIDWDEVVKRTGFPQNNHVIPVITC